METVRPNILLFTDRSCIFFYCLLTEAMLLFTNIYFFHLTGHSDTKYSMKYNLFWPWQFERNVTFCTFAKVNHALTIQLSIIITGLLAPNFTFNVSAYFKDSDPSIPECTMWYSQ